MEKTELSPDISFKGTIKFKSYLKISCNFEGRVYSDLGTLVISQGAKVSAQIEANKVLNYGHIMGDLQVNSTLYLYKGSFLEGNIKTNKLSIEEDAYFKGSCDMTMIIPSEEEKLNNLDLPLLDKREVTET